MKNNKFSFKKLKKSSVVLLAGFAMLGSGATVYATTSGTFNVEIEALG